MNTASKRLLAIIVGCIGLLALALSLFSLYRELVISEQLGYLSNRITNAALGVIGALLSLVWAKSLYGKKESPPVTRSRRFAYIYISVVVVLALGLLLGKK